MNWGTRIVALAILIALAIIGFTSVTHSPRFAMIRTVDVLQLIGYGFAFGVAFGFVLLFRRIWK